MTFRSEPDTEARASLLNQGNAQMAVSVPAAVLEKLERHRGLSVLQTAKYMTVYLAFNTSRSYLSDPAVRRALCMAVDREQFVAQVFRGGAMTAVGSVPPTFLRPKRDGSPPFDLDRARLTLAGAPISSRTLTLYVWREARPYLPDPGRAVELLAASFRTAGIKVTPVLVTYDERAKTIDKGLFDMALIGWAPEYPDAENIYWLLGPQGFAPFADTEFNGLLSKADEELDSTAREELFAQIESMVALKRPWLPLAHVADNLVVRHEVKGYQFGLQTGTPYLKDAFLTP